jgi:acyl-CoA synthetase (AMP-forming)/AMP-acid ligase II
LRQRPASAFLSATESEAPTMNISLTLRQIAERAPDLPAIEYAGATTTYGAFEAAVAGFAGALKTRGLAPRDRVAIAMENRPEFLIALYGIWRAGMTAVPMNAKLHPKEFAFILENSESRLCLATPKIAEGLAAEVDLPIVVTGAAAFAEMLAAPPVHDVDGAPEDVAWLFYTSGTTGRPKGAALTHRNLMAASLAYFADVDRVGPEDARLHAAPMSHGSGLYALPFIMKGARNLIPEHGFDPDEIFDLLARERNISFFAAPTMVTRLINHPRAETADTRGLKTICYGGAPMYLADLKRALKIFGPRLYQLLGQGESPMTITHVTKAMHADAAHPRYDEILSSVGVARSGCLVKIIGGDWAELPRGEIGEIATKGDCVMAGYWMNPEATAKTILDGWLRTGDLGFMDKEGFVTLKDRSKDMLISGGSNIYPREVEEVLLHAPGVAEVAVVGRPHPDWGEEVVAFVVRAPGADVDAAALDAHCLANLARFKRPRAYRFVAALPKNNYGKVLKTDLRAALAEEG